jgi:hypothetical protein
MEARQPTGGKWVARAVYGLLLLVLVSVAWWALSESTPSEPPPLPTARSPASPPPPPPPRDLDRDEPPPLAVQDEPAAPPQFESSVPARPPVPTVLTPRPPKHPVDADALARESVLIDRARSEVKSDPETALKTLAEHKQTFPGGPLTREAELVRVEALLRLGRREEAENLGRKLTVHDPSGPTGRTVQRLLNDVRAH